MEWMSGGSWYDSLGEEPPPPAYQRIRAARETASALAYLHHPLIGIIHGDIKGLNVLRARDGSSKVPSLASAPPQLTCAHAPAAAGVRLWRRCTHDGHAIYDSFSRRQQDGDNSSVVCARAVYGRGKDILQRHVRVWRVHVGALDVHGALR